MRLNIFMTGGSTQRPGAFLSLSGSNELEPDDMQRCGYIDLPDIDRSILDSIIERVDERHSAMGDGVRIAIGEFLANARPELVVLELLETLQGFYFSHIPFTVRFVIQSHIKAPFVTELQRRTLASTAV